MRGFLGVPILLRGRAFGNLYLAEKESESFTEQDEELVGTLASQAAVAIENARLYEAATSWSEQLEALNEVGTALASEIELARLLELIARRLRGLIDARLVTIALPVADGTLRIEAADGNGAREIVGLQLEQAGRRAAGCWSGAGPSGSTRSSTTPRSTRKRPDASAPAVGSTFP